MQDFTFNSMNVVEKIAISGLAPKPKGMFQSLKFLGKNELRITSYGRLDWTISRKEG